MRDQTRLLLERIKTSRATPKLGIAHIEAMARDVQELGLETFLAQVGAVLEPAVAASGTARSTPAVDPEVAKAFRNAEARTSLPRRAFLDAVMARAIAEHGQELQLPKRKHTMPAVMAAYTERLGADSVIELLWAVAAANSRNR
ncbi:MAG: hypothetical protein KTR31_19600 [Myxococcales bacterium]|nr:hypothetical protein [Myxococcales bacterium]